MRRQGRGCSKLFTTPQGAEERTFPDELRRPLVVLTRRKCSFVSESENKRRKLEARRSRTRQGTTVSPADALRLRPDSAFLFGPASIHIDGACRERLCAHSRENQFE